MKELTYSGIGEVGSVPWGTHFCHFYRSLRESNNLLVSYFSAGLENNELCIYVFSKPRQQSEFLRRIKEHNPLFDQYLGQGQFRIFTSRQWYISQGYFNPDIVINKCLEELNKARISGYSGLRISMDISWVKDDNWNCFLDYEEKFDKILQSYNILSCCNCFLSIISPDKLIQISNNHHISIFWRNSEKIKVVMNSSREIISKYREEEEQYKALFESALIGSFVIDSVSMKVVLANNTAARVYGFDSAQDILGINPLDFVVPEDRDKAMKIIMEDMFAEDKRQVNEFRTLNRFGFEIWIRAVGARINFMGRIAGLVTFWDITEQKKMEKALEQSEENFRHALDDSPLGVRIVAKDGRTIYTNQAMLNIYGYHTINELNEIPLKERYTAQSYEQFKVRQRKMAMGIPVPMNYAISIFRKDGEIRHLEVFHKTIKWNGEDRELVLYHDVTEREEARLKAAFMRSLLGAVRDINQLISRENDRLKLIQRCCDILGCVDEQSRVCIVLTDDDRKVKSIAQCGVNTFDFTHFEHRLMEGFLPNCINKAIEHNSGAPLVLMENYECETCPLLRGHLDQQRVVTGLWYDKHFYGALLVSGKSNFIYDDDVRELIKEVSGDIAYALHNLDLQDERIRVLYELDQTQKLLSGIVQTIKEPLLVLNDRLEIIMANNAYFDVFHCSKEQVIGQNIYEFYFKAWNVNVLKKLIQSVVQSDEHVDDLEVEIDLPGFGRRIILINARRLKTTYKGESLLLLALRDITESRRMMEQMIMQDRLAAVGELTSGVAHEINNPLTGIIGFSEMLLNSDLPENVKADIANINSEGKRISEIVRSLLAFSRRQPKEKAMVNVNQIVERVLGLRAYEQKVNNIKVVTEFESDVLPVLANASQLQQVFLNIVINAEYFMKEAHEGGTLKVGTKNIENMVIIYFDDDGPGIAREHLNDIFNPFFTTKPMGKGTGLGLSISKGIITEHGGNIRVVSEPDKGAKFIIELPAIK